MLNWTLNEGMSELNLPKTCGLAGVAKNCKYLDDTTFYGEIDIWDDLIQEDLAGLIFMRKGPNSRQICTVETKIVHPKVKEKIVIMEGKALVEKILTENYQSVKCKIKEEPNEN